MEPEIEAEKKKTGWLTLGGRIKNPLPLVLLFLALGTIGGFLHLTNEIRDDDTRSFDERAILSLREPGDTSDPIGSAHVEVIARDITALGGFTVLSIVAIISLGAAIFSGRRKLGWLALGAVICGSGISTVLKAGYARPRPDLVEHGVYVSNASFPSGHSMMSAVVYLTLGILLARSQTRHRVRVFIIAIAMLMTVLVGISRVYLGVHWPTDVLGGWMLGAAWSVLFWLVAIKVDPRTPREAGC